MKQFFLACAMAAASVSAFAGDVGVSVSVNQPGLYGRIDINQAPTPPTVIYQQPVVISPPQTVVVERRPIYLHVPPGHSRDWRRYCGRYNACGQPVYFVRDDWYRDHYYHDHHDRHEDRHHHHHGRRHGHDRDD